MDHLYSFLFSEIEPNMKEKESFLWIFFLCWHLWYSYWIVCFGFFFFVLFKFTVFLLPRISVSNQLQCSSFLAFDFRANVFIIV